MEYQWSLTVCVWHQWAVDIMRPVSGQWHDDSVGLDEVNTAWLYLCCFYLLMVLCLLSTVCCMLLLSWPNYPITSLPFEISNHLQNYLSFFAVCKLMSCIVAMMTTVALNNSYHPPTEIQQWQNCKTYFLCAVEYGTFHLGSISQSCLSSVTVLIQVL